MRKLILMVLAGAAIALAAPEFASSTPLAPVGGLATAADAVSNTDQVRHRRWHHRRWHHRHWRHRHWHYRYHSRWHRYHHPRWHRHWHRRHCWHRRYWSGRRCVWR